ncbi:MAG: flagellar protein FlgN [Desulforhopalus sp.]
MYSGDTRQYLVRLRDVILEERACAMALDIQGMTAAMQAKEQLLKVITHLQVIEDDDRPLVAQIKQENRRNAFLFKSTLGWIRQTMEFFGKNSVTSTYSSTAGRISSQVNGRLLSGKI